MFFSSLREEIQHRQQNLILAKKTLKNINYIDVFPDFPSFLPLLLNKRDEVRYELMRHSIYLAVHWPAIEQSGNTLSDKLLSLPLDSRYTIKEIECMCNIITMVEN